MLRLIRYQGICEHISIKEPSRHVVVPPFPKSPIFILFGIYQLGLWTLSLYVNVTRTTSCYKRPEVAPNLFAETSFMSTKEKPEMDSTPSSSTVSRSVLLLLRVLTFVFLLIALILITITKDTVDSGDEELKFKFNDFHAYRYMISTIVIGFAYNLLQMALSIFSVVSGKRVLIGNGGYLFDFFGDKIISYILLSGSAAGFGASEDLHRIFKAVEIPFNSFFAKANASAGLLLLGFLSTAIASIFTSFALPKKD